MLHVALALSTTPEHCMPGGCHWDPSALQAVHHILGSDLLVWPQVARRWAGVLLSRLLTQRGAAGAPDKGP